MKKDQTTTTIRFDSDFLAELQMLMIRRRVPSMRDLVTGLLQRWMEDPEFDWTTLAAMSQETGAFPVVSSEEIRADMRAAVTEALKDSLPAGLGLSLAEAKSAKVPVSGAEESGSGEVADPLWHKMLDHLFASGNPRVRRAVIQQLFSIGELVDLAVQGSPDEKNNNPSSNPHNHREKPNNQKTSVKVA